MSGEVWISSLLSEHSLFSHQGAREKYFGRPWAPASDVFESSQDADANVTQKYNSGHNVGREKLIEAMFVFDRKKWSRRKQVFGAGNFLGVKGRLAEVLQQFDLGDGALYEFPVYEADKQTLAEGGPYYVLSFGCIKDTMVPEECKRLRVRRQKDLHGYDRWADYGDMKDDEIAVSPAALEGPDLWFEEKLENRVFMSGRLHDAIEVARTGVDFRFARARIAA